MSKVLSGSVIQLLLTISLCQAAEVPSPITKDLAAAAPSAAQEVPNSLLQLKKPSSAAPSSTVPPTLYRCDGPINRVIDVADEGVRATAAIFGSSPGGGEGGQFDPVPVLSTQVNLMNARCLDAHFSAMLVGRQQPPSTWFPASTLAAFQVTLTRVSPPVLGPVHMVGHYETPKGIASPAVFFEPEKTVDMFASNFFQRLGNGPHEVPPGIYRVDVWWAGLEAGPPLPNGGAVGADFVLKLYTR